MILDIDGVDVKIRAKSVEVKMLDGILTWVLGVEMRDSGGAVIDTWSVEDALSAGETTALEGIVRGRLRGALFGG